MGACDQEWNLRQRGQEFTLSTGENAVKSASLSSSGTYSAKWLDFSSFVEVEAGFFPPQHDDVLK